MRRLSLLDPLFRWDAVEDRFSDRARLQAMLDFEAALARAEARAGVIPAAAAEAIAARCRAEPFDLEALARAPRPSPATSPSRSSAAHGAAWRRTIRRPPATSTGAPPARTRSTPASCCSSARRSTRSTASSPAGATRWPAGARHRATPMAGPHLHAARGAHDVRPEGRGLARRGDRAPRAGSPRCGARALVLQLGGAVGNAGRARRQGARVPRALAAELALPLPDLPWHAHRDRLAEVATALGLCTGTLGKIARDLALPSQTEIGELSEPAAEGRGGSSTMPQKRNPVARAVALAAAPRVPGPRRDDAGRDGRRRTSAASAAGRRSGRRCPSSSACSPARSIT